MEKICPCETEKARNNTTPTATKPTRECPCVDITDVEKLCPDLITGDPKTCTKGVSCKV